MKKEIALLLGYLRNQYRVIEKIYKEVKEEDLSTKKKAIYVGYLVHNLYCCFEDLFQEIARTFENRIEDFTRYHRELLKRISIDVPGIRPRVFSEESFHLLDEIRGFRHIFRHSYDYELSSRRIEELKERLLQGWDGIKKDLKGFENFLEKSLKENNK